jgi:hypothetical protein
MIVFLSMDIDLFWLRCFVFICVKCVISTSAWSCLCCGVQCRHKFFCSFSGSFLVVILY